MTVGILLLANRHFKTQPIRNLPLQTTRLDAHVACTCFSCHTGPVGGGQHQVFALMVTRGKMYMWYPLERVQGSGNAGEHYSTYTYTFLVVRGRYFETASFKMSRRSNVGAYVGATLNAA